MGKPPLGVNRILYLLFLELKKPNGRGLKCAHKPKEVQLPFYSVTLESLLNNDLTTFPAFPSESGIVLT